MLATANPVEYEGTYPLPEAQLDRFLLRVAFGYPTADEEWDVLTRRIDRRREEQSVEPVTDAAGLLALQQACEAVTVDATVGRYCVELAAATRRHRQVLIGASPRGSLALLLTARAHAAHRGSGLRPARGRQGRRGSPRWPTASPSGRSCGCTTSTVAAVVADVLGTVPTPPTVRPAARAVIASGRRRGRGSRRRPTSARSPSPSPCSSSRRSGGASTWRSSPCPSSPPPPGVPASARRHDHGVDGRRGPRPCSRASRRRHP